MLIHEMESLLRNVDTRLGRIEQILPTLALKDDLRSLRTDFETSHLHLKVLYEDMKGDIRLLAEHLSGQMQKLSDMSERMSDMSERMSDMTERMSDMSAVLDRLDRGR